jgi:CRISPR-associated protein Cas8a1/Csx13
MVKIVGKSSIAMHLHGPGMGLMHRAGLGGLASTLKAIERDFHDKSITQKSLPAPFVDNQPPWKITSDSIELFFPSPEKAGGYLERLFALAFRIRKDGLIYLRGQFFEEPPSPVLADMQLGLTLTFLQHGGVRKLEKELTEVSYDPESSGTPGVTVSYKKCSGFKHQNCWQELIGKNGCLKPGFFSVEGPISPGNVVRHVAFTSDTVIKEPVEKILPLYFAIVGCLPLPVNRGVAALLVPEVEDLIQFSESRPVMTPLTVTQCHVANAADAILQAQLRLKTRKISKKASLPGCYAMTLRPTPWASQQKSRVASIHVTSTSESVLERFEIALAKLPPKIVQKAEKIKSKGKGKLKGVVERVQSFRLDSVVRPLVAENLALGKRWYQGFTALMTKNNPSNDKPFRDQLVFEKGGLHSMIADKKMWEVESEQLVVQAIHEAIRQTLGRIREETDGKSSKGLSQATKNRWDKFRNKLRLGLAGAKTGSQIRFVLVDLFSRGGSNSILRKDWIKILPVIQSDWQLVRDLGLLALASYSGKGEDDSTATITNETKGL